MYLRKDGITEIETKDVSILANQVAKHGGKHT